MSPGVGKFVESLPLITSQGSHRAVPMGRGYGNIAQGSHAVAPSCVGYRRMMMDEKTVSLAHTLFIQGCPGSFSCPSIHCSTLDTTHLHLKSHGLGPN